MVSGSAENEPAEEGGDVKIGSRETIMAGTSGRAFAPCTNFLALREHLS
jgi:hypothetical protein